MELIDPRESAGERDTLLDFVRFHRTVLRRKAEGLGAEDLARQACPPSDLSLGALVKHLAFVEDYWFGYRVAGAGQGEPWASAPWEQDGDWEMHSAAADSPEQLLALFDAACTRSDAALKGRTDLDAPLARPAEGRDTTLRWVLVHMVEEYARHCGHADLLRQAIDGATGD